MRYCPVKRGPLRRIWAYLFASAAVVANLPRLARMLLKVATVRPSIIHVNNGKEGLLAARLLRIPLVWHLHGVSPDIRRISNAAATFISISKHISTQAVRHGVAAERILDIPNPAPVCAHAPVRRSEWTSRYDLPMQAVVLAHVGRLVRWKGQLEFLEAFARIADEHPSAVALIVGDDVEGYNTEYPRTLRQFVHDRRLNGRVVFTGHVTNILELMSFSDIVVHSSIEPEPFGLVITEAMSAGAAVVAARLGAPIEIVEHGVTGLLVDPTDPTEFAQALGSLVSNKEWRMQLARAGQRVAREKYSPQSWAKQIAAAYESVAAGAVASRAAGRVAR
jgi:glycosyltransferase involved in cell wall biosynthesis